MNSQNIAIVVVAILAAIALIVFVIAKNRKDRKELWRPESNDPLEEEKTERLQERDKL